MTTSGYSEGGIEKQVRDAQTILDETHHEMGGTGKTIESLRAELDTLRADRDTYCNKGLEQQLRHDDELASARDANAKLRKALMGELSNDSVWEGYYWLEKNTTVKAGLATISGLYKILRKAELRALSEAVPVQQDLTDDECYKTYAGKISGDPDADDDEHLLGLRAVIAADRKLRDGLMR